MIRPFVPALDHGLSRRFYEALGFRAEHADSDVAVMTDGTATFILQNFYVKELAENLMLQLIVPNAHEWWIEHDPEHVSGEFSTPRPTPPAVQAWGLKVGFIQDPSGVLWHVTEIPS